MKKTSLAAAFAGGLFVTALAPTAAQAQMVDGSELRGAVIRVEFADGTMNTVNFHPDGTATIQSQSGMQTVQGRWLVQGNQLCLEVAADRRECWNYNATFQTFETLIGFDPERIKALQQGQEKVPTGA